jgi:serine/threonine protein kinase
LVAQGGMGEVYRGYNIQTGDPVAIKMIRPEFSDDPEILDLFRREASILHSFTHDAIVRYFVFSVDPQLQRAYLAMEFVEGPSLKKRLGSGPLPLAEVRILQKRVASALEAAHEHGVVHRDISPDNLIMPDGDVRSAKVIDFGIARAQRRAGEATILGGEFAGKLNYASPEQLGLAGGDVTAKSDIYSFGLVLAEALLGRPIDMAGSQAELVDKRRVVPAELAWVEPTMRPLLQAMLQPLPQNRPASMAEVAAWEPAAPKAARALKAPAVASERSGKTPALIGALIAVLSLGGVAYLFHDDLARWAGTFSARAPTAGSSEEVANSPAAKLPPLTPRHAPELAAPPEPQEGSNPSSAPTPEANPSGQTATAPIEPPPATEPTGPTTVPVTAEALADALPPKAPGPNVDLPDATVGSPYRAELPTFVDPGGKGLRLAASGLPEGLTFSDLGGGKGAIEGIPQRTTSASIGIVATNHHDRTAQMLAALVVGDKPASPPGPLAKTETPAPPPEQKPSHAPVSPPTAPPTQAETPQAPTAPPSLPTIQAPTPPSSDHNAGSPPPSTESPPIVARKETSPSERLDAEPSNNPPPVAPRSAEEKAKAFIASFDGGDCFLIEPLPGATRSHEYQAVGQAVEPFSRFDSAYKREVGVEADLTLAQISAAQCPALDLVRVAARDGRRPPRLALKNYEVGSGKPLLGTISNLERRRLYLVLVDNDGLVHRLDANINADGDAATFSVPLVPDANSVGPIQMLLAIVSDKSIPTLDTLRSAKLKTIASRLIDDARAASTSVEADYFKFVN